MSGDDTTTAKGTVIHAPMDTPGHAYCGHPGNIPSTTWEQVTCINCQAARRADEEYLRRHR